MGKLRILATGNSTQALAQARGHLFEKLMADVLRHCGYSIDRIPSVNYAGMEIDIEGRLIVADNSLYAECKCYETEVDSPKLQAFFGKYVTRWMRDKRCNGLFIALPGVNSHAKAFYKDNLESNSEMTVKLLEEDQVLDIIFKSQNAAEPSAIARSIDKQAGTPGDWHLLYTDKGLFWIQYVIPPGGAIPSRIVLFDGKGDPVSDKASVEYLIQLCPELSDFERFTVEDVGGPQRLGIAQDVEQIVEVVGSSACFEYQFPASPEYFVGRQPVLDELDSFVRELTNKKTSSRGLLFEANSGWGKSSVVLASVDRLRKMGHYAIAIDSRSASSSQFILRVIDYALRKYGWPSAYLSEDAVPPALTGFDGAVRTLVGLGHMLEKKDKIMFIFLDQFENVFFLLDALSRIRDLFLKLCDSQTNVVLGFSWKTDLIGSTSEFPYQIRETITAASKRIPLDTFSEVETTALLERLSDELRAPLRKDLSFFLSEFSQGYPWLLKKLCAHVKVQRGNGVAQADIANSLLNVEELFQEDLQGLSPEGEDALRRIAKVAPISVLQLGEEFRPEIVQSLVNARLVVRIGSKYDLYWDIFRDYLNVGRVPIQENYILRVQVGSVLKATKILSEAIGELVTNEFQKQAGLSQKSFYNLLRDMKLLGIAHIDNGKVKLQIDVPNEAKDFDAYLRDHLQARLLRNRLVSRLMKTLEAKGSLTTNKVAHLLAEWCPYVSATDQTWQMYARIFIGWMDCADLAILDSKRRTIAHYTPGAEVRKRELLLPKRRGGITMPCIQYAPVERAALRIGGAIQRNRPIDWTGFKKTTITKALITLEDVGFITRKERSWTVQPKGLAFILNPEKRPYLFAEGALKMKSFVTFIEILEAHEGTGRTLSELGFELRGKLGADWKDSTAEVNAKIMLDWARHTQLAPITFVRVRRRRSTGLTRESKVQPPLF